MNYRELVDSLSPELVATLKRAIELGRWQSGEILSAEQRGHCMRAILQWEQQHLPENERTGYIEKGIKHGGSCDGKAGPGDDGSRPLRWRDNDQ